MELIIFHGIFPNIPTFGMNIGIFYGILSVPQNIVMDLNNVMLLRIMYIKYLIMICERV